MAETVALWLEGAGAHHDVVSWAEAYGADFRAAWDACPRGDWLLGIAARVGVERPRLVAAAASAARTALDCVPADELRPEHAVSVAEAWARGEASEGDVRAAADAVAAAAPPDPAVAAAAMAAHAAALSATDPEAAPLAAVHAAEAALLGVPDCAMLSALSHAHASAADAVRRHVPFEVVAPHFA
ncbi:MAG: hypothetical protein KC776_41570 [Myxococcales bacterium]|nr:hypothetical protein [Myxococcales bacterium]